MAPIGIRGDVSPTYWRNRVRTVPSGSGAPGDSPTSIFQTLVAALTLAMVFVIQHTQACQEAVTQHNLDEILQMLPAAVTRC